MQPRAADQRGAAGFPLKDNRGLIAVLLKLLLRIHWEKTGITFVL
jgi:hypothetical protein